MKNDHPQGPLDDGLAEHLDGDRSRASESDASSDQAERARQLFADSLLERLHTGPDPQLNDRLREAFAQLDDKRPVARVIPFARGFGRQFVAAASILVGIGVLAVLMGGPGTPKAEAMLEAARANAVSGELRSFAILREWPSMGGSLRIGSLHLGDDDQYSVEIEGSFGKCHMGGHRGKHWQRGPLESSEDDRANERTSQSGPGGQREGRDRSESVGDPGEHRQFEGKSHRERGGRRPGGRDMGSLSGWLESNGVELPYVTLEEMVGLLDDGYSLQVDSVRTSNGDERQRLVATFDGQPDTNFPPRPERIELQLGRAGTGIEELSLYWSNFPRSSPKWRGGGFGRSERDPREGDEGRMQRREREERDGQRSGPPSDFADKLARRFPEGFDPQKGFDHEAFAQMKFEGVRKRLGLDESVTFEQYREADKEKLIVLRLLDEAPNLDVFEPAGDSR